MLAENVHKNTKITVLGIEGDLIPLNLNQFIIYTIDSLLNGNEITLENKKTLQVNNKIEDKDIVQINYVDQVRVNRKLFVQFQVDLFQN